MTVAEDNKFRLFSFVNELNAELDALDSQTGLLQQELKATSESTAAKQKEGHLVQQVEILLNFAQRETWST